MQHTDQEYLAAVAPGMVNGQVFALSHWGGLAQGHGNMDWLSSPPCPVAAACNKYAAVSWSDLVLE
jgi:hypothetical protein